MPRVGEIKFVDFKVNCMRDPYKTQDMQMRFIFTSEQSWFPAPCNGCNWMSGSKACELCTAYLTSMFFRSPDLDVTKPITPVQSVDGGSNK